MKSGSSDWPSCGRTAIAQHQRPRRQRRRRAAAVGRSARGPARSRAAATARAGDSRALERRVAQQDAGQRRRDGQRHHHRGQHGQRIGDGQRLEEGARTARHEEDRQQRRRRRSASRRRSALRTSSEASRMMLAVDCALPSARCWRRRRTMFSMSMMASSTTTPRAMTKPGEHHRVDRGARAVEHQPGGHQRQRNRHHADQRGPPLVEEERRARGPRADEPSSSALVRLSIASSMKVAGRKIVVSISMPGSPGRSSSSAASTPSRDLERVGPGELLDDEHQARAVVDDGVADQRLVVRMTTSATSLSA